jgi:glycosyltransferase involved in cell wall biosynthesis
VSERSVSSVGHVLWSGNIGGIERLVRDLAAEQIRQGCYVIAAFGKAEGPFVDGIGSTGADTVDLGLAAGYDIRPMRMLRGARTLHRVDVVHLHGFNPALACIALASRRPIIFTEHGNFGLGRSPRLRERLKRKLQGHFLERKVACLAANSAHTASRLREIYGISAERVRVIHNGTDFDSLGPMQVEQPSGQLRIVFLGRLVRFKRVDRLIEGVARCKVRDRLRVDIIGAGPMEPELRSMAASSGLADRIRFLGHRTDVAPLLADADAIVQPSEGEPFGLAMLEACAQGVLPIVFSDGGGVLEVLPPDGLVVDSVEALMEALEGLSESPALNIEARRQRAVWMRGHFSISAAARKYRDLYEEAVTR